MIYERRWLQRFQLTDVVPSRHRTFRIFPRHTGCYNHIGVNLYIFGVALDPPMSFFPFAYGVAWYEFN